MGDTYTVGLVFEVIGAEPDPHRFARVSAAFANALPEGSQTLTASAAVDGVATISASVPAPAPAAALHAVATALELAAAREPRGLDMLGRMRRALVQLDRPPGELPVGVPDPSPRAHPARRLPE